MERYVITVNRQFGSYGRKIARKMAKRLGIPCYDSELIHEAAEELDMPEDVVKQTEETAIPQRETHPTFFIPVSKKSTTAQDQIFEAQRHYIKEVVQKGSCIVVGRCSDYLLLDEPNALHIYIFAAHEARLRYCREKLGLDELESQRVLREVDELRNSYQMEYAGYMPDDKNHKDIIIDSATLGVDKTVEYLTMAAKMKFGLE